ncbi:csm5 family CRISPR-associated ramp protein [Fusobacterium animalis ATCC 51191]|uniref:Csm5 family CRISPR-associated ramp protein n=1 Tax=Fusobacterium animalis ATCC 51191 TaxID=997347 RepID=F9ES36_9FUSO|nr:csm5 family CRISPR-associated ramp protein [Fusobacterium animalis ATCC 51191]
MNIENMNDIKLMTRNVLGKPYIQGSSIKGALVNFLLVDYIINNRNEFLKEKKKFYQNVEEQMMIGVLKI